MGLCKCPKRKVTNQFCFEHRVNVCEYCLISSHTKCIVKSYLHWLQDSDFNPICGLCGEALTDGECIRLTCYDVFHWDCINKDALKLPPDAPSSALVCCNCKSAIIPPDKLVSPVADVVRQKLSTVGWGRKRLGLPVQVPTSQVSTVSSTPNANITDSSIKNEFEEKPVIAATNSNAKNQSLSSQSMNVDSPTPTQVFNNPHENNLQTAPQSVMSQNTHVREKFQNDGRVFDTRKEEKIDVYFDHDEDKYRRKGIRHWFSKLNGLQKKVNYARDDPNITFKRVAVMILLIVLGFMTVILILTRVGRGIADNDSFLDPRANPNIRVSDNINHGTR
eukprot:gene20598-22629_t